MGASAALLWRSNRQALCGQAAQEASPVRNASFEPWSYCPL